MTAAFDQASEAALRAEVHALLDSLAPESVPLTHSDLGYGFGGWSPAFLRRVGEMGWIGTLWPEELGGRNLPPRALWVLLQELAYQRAPAEALFYSLAVGQCIVNYGTPELHTEFLPRVLAGQVTFSEALSEPDSGSDLLSLRTTAREESDHFVLDGQKIWTSNGAFSDFAMVVVRTSADGPKARSISTFIVDLNAPGVTRNPIRDLTGEPSYSEIFFDRVEVPRTHLLGTRDGGLAQVLDALEWDRFWARCVKAPFLRRELEDLVAFVRTPPGVGAAPWDSEWVRLALADLSMDIEVCDALFEDALGSYGSTATDTSADVAAAKMFADALGQRFYEVAADVLGLYGGLSDAHPDAPFSGRVWRNGLHAHGLRIAGGTPEMQEATVATRGLGLPKARS
jgi:alkylation response protein AidB-like acyl-CoA dehydrogenase